ncbi:MAG TPA: hypothetical protein VMM77_09565 [Gemmatimonadaceae bacterium]|nr:hypothetical protein [Gemmatimonadaceae bacterium]
MALNIWTAGDRVCDSIQLLSPKEDSRPVFRVNAGRPTRQDHGPCLALKREMRLRHLVVVTALGFLACDSGSPANRPVSAAEREAITDTLTRLIAQAYDFSRDGVSERLLSLYPDTGRVVAASAGQVTTSRSALDSAIGSFWEIVGQNMRDPTWVWGDIYVDVLASDAAAVTATYSIPHHTPLGRPHTIAGAWTAVFVRMGGEWVVVQEHLSDVPVVPDSTSEHVHDGA